MTDVQFRVLQEFNAADQASTNLDRYLDRLIAEGKQINVTTLDLAHWLAQETKQALARVLVVCR